MMDPIIEHRGDDQQSHTILDYKKENRKLSDKLSSVTKKLLAAQSKLREERKLQERKLNELGLKLIEFEEDLRADQKKVKSLLKRKDKQLVEKDKLIEALRCQLNAYESRISCESQIGFKVSDYSVVQPRREHEVSNAHPTDSGTERSRDFSRLLYLDLNTDQFNGRRFYAHRDLSPVAEVREDLEELITSPGRSSSQGKRSLFGSLENDKTVINRQKLNIDCKDTPTEEKGKSQPTTQVSCDNGVNVPTSNVQEFSDALISSLKDQISPKTMLGVEGDMANLNDISDRDSDDVRTIIMNGQNTNILSEGILNSSFEDQMLNITSDLVSSKRENETGKYFFRDSDDNSSYLRRAQKEIRRSLVIDESEDFDEKDEFYDCPTALSDHTGNINIPQKQKIHHEHEIGAGDSTRIPLVDGSNAYHNEHSDNDANKLSSGMRNESPDSEGTASAKEEWSDAQDSVSDHGNDDAVDSEQFSTPKKSLDNINKSDSKDVSSDKTCTNPNTKPSASQHNGLGNDLSGVTITSYNDIDSTKKNNRNKQNMPCTPGDTTLEEYDVIDIDVDAKLSG